MDKRESYSLKSCVHLWGGREGEAKIEGVLEVKQPEEVAKESAVCMG
jgi:hypothetical protein